LGRDVLGRDCGSEGHDESCDDRARNPDGHGAISHIDWVLDL